MTSSQERFWIVFILRFAFGFLFLIAAINIFSAGPRVSDFGPDWFAKNLTKDFDKGWMGEIPNVPNIFEGWRPFGGNEADAAAEGAKAVAKKPAAAPASTPVHPAYYFLFCLPFIFTLLSVPILLGVFLKPALRSGALLLVALGLGKYISDGKDLSTTANDFFFAFLICVGLYFMSQQQDQQESAAA